MLSFARPLSLPLSVFLACCVLLLVAAEPLAAQTADSGARGC